MSLLTRLRSYASTTKDVEEPITKDEKAEADVNVSSQPVLPSQLVQQPTARQAIVSRIGRIAKKRSRFKRLGYAIIGILLITIWIGVTVNFAQSETKNQAKNAAGATAFTQDSGTHSQGQGFFLLQGNLVEFDADQRSLTVSWSGLYLLNGKVEPFGNSSTSAFAIGLYESEELIVGGNPNFGYELANSTAVPVGVFYNPWQNYDTGIDMGQLSADNAWHQPSFGFPFDRWTGSITLGATFRDCKTGMPTNTSLAESNLCGTYWDFAYLTGSIINWKFDLEQVDTCLDETVASCNLIVTINATRSGLVIFACVVAVMVNWFSTIFIFVMTMEGVIMRHFKVIDGPQLLAVCFTALFALPSVRSILPGAPEFGALIDIVGIVPNVIIISLCTTMVAIASLRNFIRANREKDKQVGDKLEAASA